MSSFPSSLPNSLPIGVFDSGIGGLTVVSAIQRRLPNEKIIYVGDTARVPYGSRSRETIVGYAKEIASFLENFGVKEIVIACNTASALALDAVAEQCGVPVSGVIEPGVLAAIELTGGPIGIMATRATVKSGAYEQAIVKAGSEIDVTSIATPLLVPLIEEDCIDQPFARDILKHYIDDSALSKCAALILGCTHYPLIASKISELVAAEIVDTPSAVAESLCQRLGERQALRAPDSPGEFQMFLTDEPNRSLDIISNRLRLNIDQVDKVLL